MTRTRLAAALSSLRLAFAGAPALALCLAGGARAQDALPTPAPTPNPSRVFQEARPVAVKAGRNPGAFEFEMNGFSYHVVINGNGRRTKGDRTRRFNLRVDGEIERLYFSEYRGDVLVVCELDQGETGEGVVTRLEQPSMRGRWRQVVPTFNVGEPLRDGRHLYVTAIGFVAKLDLETGEYVWEHAALYGRVGAETFNSFDVPEIVGDEVSFGDRRSYNPKHRVVVNKKTGKIVRVE